MIALRPKIGEMVWHCQFSPNDPDDHAATEVGLLVDIKIDGPPRQVLAQANRNGFFSVLDRVNGKLLVATPTSRPTRPTRSTWPLAGRSSAT